MANSPTPPAMIPTAVLALGLAFLICAGRPTAAQDCGCQPGFCCSKFGYCGKTSDYCGEGCKSGPCWGSGGGRSASMASVVTESFNGIKSHAGRELVRGHRLLHAKRVPQGRRRVPGLRAWRLGPSEVEGKREIAAFFAHVTHETWRK